MTPSENCYDLTKSMEGLRLKAYQDSGGVWTIGYGHTGEEAQPNNIISGVEADNLLVKDMQYSADMVNGMELNFNQNQFDALCDLIYNCGIERLKKTYPTFLKAIKCNPDNFERICSMWLGVACHDAKGNTLTGLQHRRLLESNLYKK